MTLGVNFADDSPAFICFGTQVSSLDYYISATSAFKTEDNQPRRCQSELGMSTDAKTH